MSLTSKQRRIAGQEALDRLLQLEPQEVLLRFSKTLFQQARILVLAIHSLKSDDGVSVTSHYFLLLASDPPEFRGHSMSFYSALTSCAQKLTDDAVLAHGWPSIPSLVKVWALSGPLNWIVANLPSDGDRSTGWTSMPGVPYDEFAQWVRTVCVIDQGGQNIWRRLVPYLQLPPEYPRITPMTGIWSRLN